ncbi:MAG TPA: ABC transporter ATP-binding protein [Terriglobales bacterium]|nr:ABC transporter ATP-binding protein [Terriglobales bacterium]
MPPVLEYERIMKEYRSWTGRRRIRALEDFSLAVERGEIFGFLGPNGAGKSTAIHLAMGFMKPSAGKGRMLGKPFGHVATRRRIGFLAENVALYHRRAGAALRFYGGLSGLHGQALTRAATAAMQAVDMQAEVGRNLAQFSRGMVQRMGLAQALVNDPELLILDEPTSALDPAARVAVRELLLRCRDQGKTVFLSSHLLSEVELVCDRVAILSRGRVVRTGTLNDMLEITGQVEIVAEQVPLTLFAGAAMDGSRVRFLVRGNEQRRAIERVWATGGEVVSVNPVRRSLEELFLELTRDRTEDDRADRGVS